MQNSPLTLDEFQHSDATALDTEHRAALSVEMISPNLHVSGQISVSDVVQLALRGYRSIVCNRPDDEDGGMHPSHRALQAQCEAVGLQFFYYPVSPVAQSEQQVRDMCEILRSVDEPTLVYCRSGRRSRALIALGEKLRDSYHPESFG